jgi:hypothetical protein
MVTDIPFPGVKRGGVTLTIQLHLALMSRISGSNTSSPAWSLHGGRDSFALL